MAIVSRKGFPIVSLLWPARPARRKRGAEPMVQMRELRRPGQHGAGDAEIVVLSGKAFIDGAALAQLGLKRYQLLMSALGHQSVDNADLTGSSGRSAIFRGDGLSALGRRSTLLIQLAKGFYHIS